MDAAPAPERVRLICFPYAGGGPGAFRRWRHGFSPDIGLYVVHLPGREERLEEPCFSRLESLVDSVVAELGLLDDMPFALFGHSMGALLAFEAARKLQHVAAKQPCGLFVSALHAPELVAERERTYDLPEEQFVRKLAQVGGTPAQVLANRDLLKLVLPTLRADFSLVDTYRYERGNALTCPITAFSGSADTYCSFRTMAGWREKTSGSFIHHEIQGGHFFMHTQQAQLQRLIETHLEPRSETSWLAQT